MSLATMQAQGSNAYVARNLADSRTEAEILTGLSQRFPGQQARSYQAAYNAGLQAWQSATILEQFDPSFPLTPGMVPSSGGLRRGYRVYLIADVYDPFLNVTFNASIDLTFNTIPDEAQIQAALQARVSQLYGGPGGGVTRYKSLGTPIGSVAEYVAVERTS